MDFLEFLVEYHGVQLDESTKSFDSIPNVGNVQSVIDNKLFKLEHTLYQLRITKDSKVVKVGSYKENILDVVTKLNKLHDYEKSGNRVRGFVIVKKSGSSVFVIENRKTWAIDLKTKVGHFNTNTQLAGLKSPFLNTIKLALQYEDMLDDEQKTVYAFFDDPNAEQ